MGAFIVLPVVPLLSIYYMYYWCNWTTMVPIVSIGPGQFWRTNAIDFTSVTNGSPMEIGNIFTITVL